MGRIIFYFSSGLSCIYKPQHSRMMQVLDSPLYVIHAAIVQVWAARFLPKCSDLLIALIASDGTHRYAYCMCIRFFPTQIFSEIFVTISSESFQSAWLRWLVELMQLEKAHQAWVHRRSRPV